MIELRHLTKQYGHQCAIKDLSLKIWEKNILGFLGRNGAGKSTTMNLITGYLAPTDGDVFIDGLGLLDDPIAARAKIGFMPEQPPLYPDMSVKEYLRFVCELKRIPPRSVAVEVDRLLDAVDIRDMKDRLIRNLSRGYRQRVGIAQAMAGSPPYIILDEPTAGLDPVQITEVRDMIRRLGEEHTVILSSHILPEVAEVCTHVVIIHSGEILADTPMKALESNGCCLRVRLRAPAEPAVAMLASLPGVQRAVPGPDVEPEAVDVAVYGPEDTDLRIAIFNLAVQKQWPLLEMRQVHMDLEQFFLDAVERKERGGA